MRNVCRCNTKQHHGAECITFTTNTTSRHNHQILTNILKLNLQHQRQRRHTQGSTKGQKESLGGATSNEATKGDGFSCLRYFVVVCFHVSHNLSSLLPKLLSSLCCFSGTNIRLPLHLGLRTPLNLTPQSRKRRRIQRQRGVVRRFRVGRCK